MFETGYDLDPPQYQGFQCDRITLLITKNPTESYKSTLENNPSKFGSF